MAMYVASSVAVVCMRLVVGGTVFNDCYLDENDCG